MSPMLENYLVVPDLRLNSEPGHLTNSLVSEWIVYGIKGVGISITTLIFGKT